jgi:two-component system, cell cycle response regulator DivK
MFLPMGTELQPGRHQPSEPHKALVLVVDDFADNREMYSEYLSFSGYDVIEAKNGLEAIAAAQDRMPDIIVMDLSLPLMDGWEATRRLKADERTRQIPVVALTGHALAGHSRGAREAGCDSFLAKPCLPDQLVAEIRRMLESGKATIARTRGPR